MYLFVTILNRSDQPEKAIERLREFGIPAPVLIRARSAAAALSAEVPVFGGLRSLALGADEDRLLLLSLADVSSSPEEVERLVTRVQLEMDADEPPMGRLVAIPVIGADLGRA